jgi:hypothetical protein
VLLIARLARLGLRLHALPILTPTTVASAAGRALFKDHRAGDLRFVMYHHRRVSAQPGCFFAQGSLNDGGIHVFARRFGSDFAQPQV